jgi:Ca-activated chloride channel family protein
MQFHDPLLLALALIVLPACFFLRRRGEGPGMRFSSGRLLAGMKETSRVKAIRYMPLLRALAAVLIVIALARPQAVSEEVTILKEGIDIVLAVDVSTSMLAEDFQVQGEKKNRLAAAKDVMKEFVRARDNDRIGMIVFGSRAYPVSPITFDHDWLRENLQRVEIGMVEDGTAIGSGLMSALNSLKNSTAKSRVIILLTDGRNNAGAITAEGAAAAAKALGVKVYAVGIGSRGRARYPVRDPFGRIIYKTADADIDEGTLQMIASASGGRYFRATDTEALRNIYREIDGLEKTKSETKVYYNYQELFPFFLLPAFFLLLLELVLTNTGLRTAPS